MKKHIIFKILVFICLFAIIAISLLYYFNFLVINKFIIDDKLFAISSAIIALCAAFFSIFTNKPVEKETITVAVDKLLASYETEAVESLMKTRREINGAKEEEKKLRDYLDKKSNEIFLVKIRSYLIDEAIKSYQESHTKRIIEEIEVIEQKLNAMKVQYKELELPERFKNLLNELDGRKRIDLYLDLLDVIPFLPFKRALKAYVKIQIQQGNISSKEILSNFLTKKNKNQEI